MSKSRGYTSKVEEIRRREYSYIKDATYLDHAGCTLYPSSLMQRFTADLTNNLFGNPHSANPSSTLSSNRVDNVRARVLQFFNADPAHFDVVFVANATAGIKVVMDSFRDLPTGFWYGYHRDCHTSLVGVREHARESRIFTTDDDVESWISAASELEPNTTSSTPRLFAYPAQSNMNGRRSPLRWCADIRKSKPRTYTLLDAAAFLTTGNLDLSNPDTAPDFITLSFYKIFGFPDLGALIVRKASSEILTNRRYFGGGTVEMVVSIGMSWHAKRRDKIYEALEDGTLPFHNIIALGHAMDVYQELYGTAGSVSIHTANLANITYEKMAAMRYANGEKVVEIYKDSKASYSDSTTQGPTIAFNVRKPDGTWIGKTKVEKLAIKRGIHLRTGGVCNPGGIATVLGFGAQDMLKNHQAGMKCGDTNDLINGNPTGIVRVSFGGMSSMADVQVFLDFMEECFVKRGGMATTAYPPTTQAMLKVPTDEKSGDETYGSMEAVSIRSEGKTGGFRNLLRNLRLRNGSRTSMVRNS